MKNGTELFSCSPQDTLTLGSNGSFEFDQLASGAAVPSTVKTIGTYNLSGNSLASQTTATTYALQNGVFTATGSSPANAAYSYALSGNTLMVTTPQGVTITLAAQ
jgi:hypothetical protein